ncbi:MAG: GNAT family N-acetyltransferase [Flavobacteriales bacterium]
MIRYVRHTDIDKAAWDLRLDVCANKMWYGLSSVLDAASPNWDALIDPETGAQMPILWRRKYGVRYAYQPFMLQQSGPYSPDQFRSDPLRFLHAWPKEFRYADINIGWTADRSAPQGTTLSERTDHELRLDLSIDELRAAYSENHRRSLRKAAMGEPRFDDTITTAEIIGLLEGSEQFVKWKVRGPERDSMRRMMEVADHTGMGFGRAIREGDELVAAGYFTLWGGRLIFLKGLSTPRGRELRAMHALIDHVVEQYAGSGIIFDFAGGNDPQLARFYSGFGALPILYLRALMNRLPRFVRQLKK